MPALPPAEIGAPFSEIDTPALVIDLDAMERNLALMAERVRALGIRIRPHAKTHKSAIIAAQQVALGAVGVCCQKVAEAEALAAGGVRDILISNEVVGARKLTRLAALARHIRIAVCVDEFAQIALLGDAARQAGARIEVLVEIDVGGRRCGVTPGPEATRFAAEIARHDHLRFGGLQAYHGSAQHLRTPAERKAAIDAAQQAVMDTLTPLQAAGFTCDTIGGAGTGTFPIEGASGVWNELQAGSYIFMDADYARNVADEGGNAPRFDHALFVLATVISAVKDTQVVVDAGHKALSNDSGFPVVWQRPGLSYHRPSDEHGVVAVAPGAQKPAWGDKLLLVPGHCDPTVNLYDWYVGVRDFGTPHARVETLWPVDGRGAVT
ncbi:DSD1 family PLP-dependent enzyme [Undibacter mobilis]|uniref:DSD1 family PLP-dependent enzyme n=1 Tax=Undibacter mobilis TaxID=2292256 RepID=A0A371B8C7_9BRAD|nr:DSD1 family PLP-dependent enzyme [Undibacter mobilis]RDV03777.1 DSD1 family PLP-dependent enzyme [Undibacter mobilis]